MNRPNPESLQTRLGRVGAALADPSSYQLLASRALENLEAPRPVAPRPAVALDDQSLLCASAAHGYPRIIFQTWKSKTIIPANYAHWRETFLALNPNHVAPLWDDDDNRRFISAHYAWFLPQYDAYPKEIYRADMVRPFFLFRYGGVYADMDCECVRPLEDARWRGDVVLGRMGADPRFEHSIPNASMIARPRQMFWLVLIALAIERFRAAADWPGPEQLTGPILLRDTVALVQSPDLRSEREALLVRHIPPDLIAQAENGTLEVLPPAAFYPVNWNNPAHQIFRRNLLRRKKVLSPGGAAKLFPKASIVTYWSHSW